MSFVVKQENGFNYVEEGEGPVLLLLHGLLGGLSNWEKVIEEFRPAYRLILPTLPVFDLPVLNTGVKTLSKFLHEFITFKKLEDITLLGNSLGGHVGLIYTLAHPAKVKAVVLSGSSGLYEDSFGGSFPRRESREYIKGRVEYTFYNPEIATPELVDEIYKTVNHRPSVIRLLAMAKSAIRHNMRPDLPKIQPPAFLIWGKNDKITPPEVAEEFDSLLPQSELHWIDECGHAAMMERPQQFNRLLRIFLSRLQSAHP